MSDLTYFRIGVPNDMVADIMWHDDFEVSIESYSKHETNYQRYFGTPEKAAESIRRLMDKTACTDLCSDCKVPFWCQSRKATAAWLESEAE